ncbi:uncharacterized protein VTP21DRAFT_9109 [Calcarisporiella thermophila]|uniref:uncharacterized protein n=1 Tax=Calcarisporiella thermophila TaxID=911321 RepID=UPI003742F873
MSSRILEARMLSESPINNPTPPFQHYPSQQSTTKRRHRPRSRSLPPNRAGYVGKVSFDLLDSSLPLLSFTLQAKSNDYRRTRWSRTFLVTTDAHSYTDYDYALGWVLERLVDDGDEIVALRVVSVELRELMLKNDAGLTPSTGIFGTTLTPEGLKAQVEQSREEAQTVMDNIMVKNKEKKISIVVEYVVGKVPDTIQSMITMYQPSLLVVGTRHRSPIKGLLLGGISRYCLQHCPIPVVVVRPEKKKKKKNRKHSSGTPGLAKRLSALLHRWATPPTRYPSSMGDSPYDAESEPESEADTRSEISSRPSETESIIFDEVSLASESTSDARRSTNSSASTSSSTSTPPKKPWRITTLVGFRHRSGNESEPENGGELSGGAGAREAIWPRLWRSSTPFHSTTSDSDQDTLDTDFVPVAYPEDYPIENKEVEKEQKESQEGNETIEGEEEKYAIPEKQKEMKLQRLQALFRFGFRLRKPKRAALGNGNEEKQEKKRKGDRKINFQDVEKSENEEGEKEKEKLQGNGAITVMEAGLKENYMDESRESHIDGLTENSSQEEPVGDDEEARTLEEVGTEHVGMEETGGVNAKLDEDEGLKPSDDESVASDDTIKDHNHRSISESYYSSEHPHLPTATTDNDPNPCDDSTANSTSSVDTASTIADESYPQSLARVFKRRHSDRLRMIMKIGTAGDRATLRSQNSTVETNESPPMPPQPLTIKCGSHDSGYAQDIEYLQNNCESLGRDWSDGYESQSSVASDATVTEKRRGDASGLMNLALQRQQLLAQQQRLLLQQQQEQWQQAAVTDAPPPPSSSELSTPSLSATPSSNSKLSDLQLENESWDRASIASESAIRGRRWRRQVRLKHEMELGATRALGGLIQSLRKPVSLSDSKNKETAAGGDRVHKRQNGRAEEVGYENVIGSGMSARSVSLQTKTYGISATSTTTSTIWSGVLAYGRQLREWTLDTRGKSKKMTVFEDDRASVRSDPTGKRRANVWRRLMDKRGEDRLPRGYEELDYWKPLPPIPIS